MRAMIFPVCGIVATVLLAIPSLRAADKPASKTTQKSPASQGVLAPPETVSGTIMMVEPASRVVVVKDSQGTEFDFVVTKATRVRAADHAIHLKDLTTDTKKPVSIRFIPERSGDIAQSIEVKG